MTESIFFLSQTPNEYEKVSMLRVLHVQMSNIQENLKRVTDTNEILQQQLNRMQDLSTRLSETHQDLRGMITHTEFEFLEFRITMKNFMIEYALAKKHSDLETAGKFHDLEVKLSAVKDRYRDMTDERNNDYDVLRRTQRENVDQIHERLNDLREKQQEDKRQLDRQGEWLQRLDSTPDIRLDELERANRKNEKEKLDLKSRVLMLERYFESHLQLLPDAPEVVSARVTRKRAN